MQKNLVYASAVSGGSVVDKRSTLPINLTPGAREVVDGFKDEFGVNKQEGVARILQKWAGLPAKVRRAFIDRDGDPVREMFEHQMALMTAAGKQGGEAEVTLEQALNVIRLMTDRIAQIEKAYRHELAAKHRKA